MQIAPKAASWSSRLAFLFAAVGAAVGLGNIWKFPYMTGVNGGGAFVLVYLAAAALVAVPILIAEILVGRRGRHSPVAAVAAVARESGRSQAWAVIGGMGVLVAYVILSYYSVIAGWATAYVFAAGRGDFSGADAAGVSGYFNELLASPVRLIFWHTVFMAMTVGIVARGLQRGIERWVNILMPALFLCLLAMIVYAAVEGDFRAGLEFLFRPDFNKINGEVVLAAVGQAFFSIGVAMGIMLAYGAYVPQEVSITRSAFIIAGADSLVAILAGIAIFPLVFANDLDPGEGAGLVFVTLPIAFAQMPGGSVFGAIFFGLLTFAALTSSIAVLEPVVAWLSERFSMARPLAALLAGVTAWIIGLGSVFSFNIWADVRLLGMFPRFADKTIFDLADYATSNVMMPVGAFLLAIFVGWRMKAEAACEELGLGDGLNFRVWRIVLLRWVAPLAILGILIANL